MPTNNIKTTDNKEFIQNITVNNKNKFIVNLTDTTDNKEFIQYLINNKSINLNLIDKINNYYITIKLNNLFVEVPFNYILINTNKKLKGIPYINFELYCSSYKLGYCTLAQKNLCYSIKDQNRFKHNYYKIKLNVMLFKLVKLNNNLFNNVIEYLKQFKYIRFNCNNDINSVKDIELLINIALALPNSIISGYTNRYDLFKDKNSLKEYNIPTNLIINGSGYKLTNNYITTTDIKTFINNKIKCNGSCANCLKCFNLKDQDIYCLLHGSLSNIDKYYNTKNNRLYLIEFFNNNFNYLNLTDKDLTVNKGLLSSLNKFFKQHKLYNEYKFKNYNDLIIYICALKGIKY